jgi:hypothetical protein
MDIKGGKYKMVKRIGEGIPNIVIPTIRDKDFFEDFLISWNDEFKGCHLIVIEDRKKKQFKKLLDSMGIGMKSIQSIFYNVNILSLNLYHLYIIYIHYPNLFLYFQ